MRDSNAHAMVGRESGRTFVLTAICLVLWTLLAAWAAFGLASAWPYVGLMPQWLLLMALPGVVFRTFDLVTMRRLRRQGRGWRRLLVRVAAFVVGARGGVGSWGTLDAVSMHRFERAMVPVVELAASAREALCAGSARSFGSDLADYLKDAQAPKAEVEFHYNAQRFVLALPGRSVDIDGSTMFYDSRSQRWRKMHNDELGRTGELSALTAGLSMCRFTLR